MSDLFDKKVEGICEKMQACTALQMIIDPKAKELGGATLRRVLPANAWKKIGPFVFFDHLGPADFKAGQGIDVRPHPHIGLATITYLFSGEILHRDSLGFVQSITPGAINLMVAGKGIVHSERTSPETRKNPHRLHALQLWIALPEADEFTDPTFYHYEASAFPEINLAGTKMKLLMGNYQNFKSPVKTFSETFYADVMLEAKAKFILPNLAEKAVYVISGNLQARDTMIMANQMAVFDATQLVEIIANEETHCVIIGGAVMTHRYLYWNYVASSMEIIEKAKQAWVDDKMGHVPGDPEFIPLPEY